MKGSNSKTHVWTAMSKRETLQIWLMLILLALVLFLLLVSPTSAAGPERQDWMYAAVQCSGLDVQQVQDGFGRYQNAYAKRHQLDTPQKWHGTYEAVVQEYARAIGCTSGLLKDGALTFDAKIYAPVFKFVLGDSPQME